MVWVTKKFPFSVKQGSCNRNLVSVSVTVPFYIVPGFLREHILCTCNGDGEKNVVHTCMYVKQEPENYSSVKSYMYPSVKMQWC